MKISKEIWKRGELERVKSFNSAEEAVEFATRSSTELAELVARFVECVYGESNGRLNKREALSYILGSGYEVEE